MSDVEMPIGDCVSSHNERFAMSNAYANAAERNHRQSLARIAERGGLVWSEAAAIVEMRPYFRMNEAEAERIVRGKLAQTGASA